MLDLDKIHLGDCLELMPSIPSKSVDMILCDLPYGTTACEWDSIIDMGRLWAEYERVIKDNGAIVLTAQGMFCAKLMTNRENWFNHDYVWIKNMHSNFALVGIQPLRIFENVLVFRPPRKDDIDIQFNKELRAYFNKVHEFIGVSKKHILNVIGQCVDHCFRYTSSQFDLCTKETYAQLIQHFKIDQMEGFLNYEALQAMKEEFHDPYTFNFDTRVKKENIKTKNDLRNEQYGNLDKRKDKEYISKEYENYPKNTLYFDVERGQHPTQKPVALFEYLIKTYTNEGELVLDNCSGSGTTAIACLNSNRRFICIEKDEGYHKKSLDRIADHEPLLHLGDKC